MDTFGGAARLQPGGEPHRGLDLDLVDGEALDVEPERDPIADIAIRSTAVATACP
jgi:hypothetical protein